MVETTTEPLMDVRATAAFLGIGDRTLYAMIRRGELPAFRVGGLWKFKRDELERWLEAQRRGSP